MAVALSSSPSPPRLSGNISDEELKELVKSEWEESPTKHVSFYRNGDCFDIASKHECLFMGVAKKQSRLNKVQLATVMTDLHKEGKQNLTEIAGVLTHAYSKILGLRRNVSNGQKTAEIAMKIIRAFNGNEKKEPDLESEIDLVESATSSNCFGGREDCSTAEELLKKTQERFEQCSPPPKKVLMDDSPLLIDDSPLKADL
jgi:hypothetical protein